MLPSWSFKTWASSAVQFHLRLTPTILHHIRCEHNLTKPDGEEMILIFHLEVTKQLCTCHHQSKDWKIHMLKNYYSILFYIETCPLCIMFTPVSISTVQAMFIPCLTHHQGCSGFNGCQSSAWISFPKTQTDKFKHSVCGHLKGFWEENDSQMSRRPWIYTTWREMKAQLSFGTDFG